MHWNCVNNTLEPNKPNKKYYVLIYLNAIKSKCKGCCLGSLCHISNTLYMCAILQQLCGTNLLYKQAHTAEVLGKTKTQLALRYSYIDKIYFGKDRFIN